MTWLSVIGIKNCLSQQLEYMGSEFLGHSGAENLLASFNEATFKLKHDKIINVSMDGPAVNHKFLRLLQAQ